MSTTQSGSWSDLPAPYRSWITAASGSTPAAATTDGPSPPVEKDSAETKPVISLVQVRGCGTNELGTFEIMGYLDLNTMVMEIQRQYVVTEIHAPSPRRRPPSIITAVARTFGMYAAEAMCLTITYDSLIPTPLRSPGPDSHASTAGRVTCRARSSTAAPCSSWAVAPPTSPRRRGSCSPSCRRRRRCPRRWSRCTARGLVTLYLCNFVTL